MTRATSTTESNNIIYDIVLCKQTTSNAYVKKLYEMSMNMEISPSIRFKLREALELRENNWIPTKRHLEET